MGAPFHETDPLDVAEQILFKVDALNAELRAALLKHRERQHARSVLVHDGSAGVDADRDEPPAAGHCP